MDTLTQNCMDKETVDSFCGCIGGNASADPAAQAFCTNAKNDPRITGEDLAELKMALSDDEGSCCDCEC